MLKVKNINVSIKILEYYQILVCMYQNLLVL